MPIRKNTLFTVPLYCIVMGVICFYLVVYGVARFAAVRLPDGSVSSSDGKVLLIYGLLMAAALAIGWRLFRRMTRKEIAVSASIMAAFQLITILLEAILSPTDSLALTFFYLSIPGEWSNFIPLLLYRLTGGELFGAVIGSFSSFLFVLFGKKEL